MKRVVCLTIFAAITATFLSAANAANGKAVFDKSCKACHGADGTPNPTVANMMKVQMRDLKSPDVQAQSDADIKSIIANGKGKMHPIKTVSGSDADDVVAYIRSLKK